MWKSTDLITFVTEHAEDGLSFTKVVKFPADIDLSLVSALGHVGVKIEGEYCQHEYDCCGRWYQQVPSIALSGDEIIVTVSYYTNL